MSSNARPQRLDSGLSLQVGTKVEIIGEPGVFLISHIDRRRHVVNLVPLQGGEPQAGIHLSAIRIHDSTSMRPYLVKESKLISEILGEGKG